MSHAAVMGSLKADGPANARELVARTGLALPFVRQALAELSPPPVGIGEVVVLPDERFAPAPPRPPIPLPEEPCPIRQSGKHAQLRRSHSGALVCPACGLPVAA